MKTQPILETDDFIVEWEESTIPWVKIFPKKECRELSECPKALRYALVDLCCLIESVMLAYYRPDKINVASFGNYLPRVHVHVMARFRDDSHFPEPTWGERQREGRLELPGKEGFEKALEKAWKEAS